MILFGSFFGALAHAILGYGLFRVASDIEKLPFPMAPVGAQGVMALAEDIDESQSDTRQGSWRWRAFAIGGALGLVFGLLYVGLPTISGALCDRPIQVLPIPFSDWSAKTQSWLPAVATGLTWDLGGLLFGMVMPFFSMVGSFLGLIMTLCANPILQNQGILWNWKPGDNTVTTLFKNNVDFYFSFHIGIVSAIALAGFWQVFRKIRERRAGAPAHGTAVMPEGRGDIRLWIVAACYLAVTTIYITASMLLLRWHDGQWHMGIFVVLIVLGFVFTPLISYVTARLEGMVGEIVEVPFLREASLILSGYQGVACWFLPVPMANYGSMTVFYRQCELTGTKFTSIWKVQFILYPVILIGSIFFMNFIWGLAEVPSAVYPYARKMWDLNAQNACIVYSSTLGDFSIFEQAFNWKYLFAGLFSGTLIFGGFSAMGTPVFLAYGVARGLGQSMHFILPQFFGALLGRYYFQRKFGLKWRQYVPVVAAGFSCGVGLVATVGVGIAFLSKSVIQLPF
jgi:hypothetical protein